MTVVQMTERRDDAREGACIAFAHDREQARIPLVVRDVDELERLAGELGFGLVEVALVADEQLATASVEAGTDPATLWR